MSNNNAAESYPPVANTFVSCKILCVATDLTLSECPKNVVMHFDCVMSQYLAVPSSLPENICALSYEKQVL